MTTRDEAQAARDEFIEKYMEQPPPISHVWGCGLIRDPDGDGWAVGVYPDVDWSGELPTEINGVKIVSIPASRPEAQ